MENRDVDGWCGRESAESLLKGESQFSLKRQLSLYQG
jgi:hypothetical protein